MVDYHTVPVFSTLYLDHLADEGTNYSADESVLPASTLSFCSEIDSASDITSFLHTARSTSPTSFLEENRFSSTALYGKDPRKSERLESWSPSAVFQGLGHEDGFSHVFHQPLDVKPFGVGYMNSDVAIDYSLRGPNNSSFTPVLKAESTNSRRSRTPSPGMSKMLLSLSDHPLERPCTPNASTLYRNTKSHCNPSELGRYTYVECMLFTEWANKFLQCSRDHVMITDLVRDLGDGLTLLSLVELLIGKYPPQIHVKPALDVQKMENIQACLDFLEQTGVSVNGIAAEDIVKGNLKVVLALCHCLQRIFGSSPGPVPLSKRALEDFSAVHQRSPESPEESDALDGTSASAQLELSYPMKPRLYQAVDKDDLSLYTWVSKLTGKQVTDFESFRDGTMLCLLLNKITEGVIPNLVLKFGSSVEKVSLALKASSEELNIETDLVSDDIIMQRSQAKFTRFLKSLHVVYSSKLKRIHEDFERNNFRRELKREQLRELRQRPGSQLTYLGELSQNKPQFNKDRQRLPSGVPTANSSFQDLTRTKDQLEELKKELELLKLECGDQYRKGGLGSHQPSSQSAKSESLGLPKREDVTRLRGKQANSRQVYRGVDRGTPSKDVAKGSRGRTNGIDHASKGLPFGGCYLSEPHSSLREGRQFDGCYLSDGFDSSIRRGLDSSIGESSTFKGMLGNSNQPSFYAGNMTFPPYSSSSRATYDSVQRNADGKRAEALEPSKIFGGRSDEDATRGTEALPGMRMSLDSDTLDSPSRANVNIGGDTSTWSSEYDRNQGLSEGRLMTLNVRMLRAENKSKLGNSSGIGSDAMDSPTRTKVNIGADTSTSSVPWPSGYDRKEGLSEGRLKSLNLLTSTNQVAKERDHSLFPYRESSTQRLGKPHAQRQRNASEETRYMDQINAENSFGVAQPSSPKTHMQALTALARMSAKKANAF